MQQKQEPDNIQALIPFEPIESNLSGIQETINAQVEKYNDKQWFWQNDSKEISSLKKWLEAHNKSDVMNPEELHEVYNLIRSYSPQGTRKSTGAIDQIKKSFYCFPLLEQIDVRKRIEPDELYLIVTRLDKSSVDLLLQLMAGLSSIELDRIDLVLTLIRNHTDLSQSYIQSLLAIAAYLGNGFKVSMEAWIDALNQSNHINESYTRALTHILRCLKRLELMTDANVLTGILTLAQADNELPINLTPIGSWFSSGQFGNPEYHSRIEGAIGNFSSFINRTKEKKEPVNPQTCFEKIFKHPTPYLYTNIICCLEDKKLDTNANIQSLLRLRDAGALYILELFAPSLSQNNFELFIAHQEVFSDRDVVIAMRHVSSGPFMKHAETVMNICNNRNPKEIKQAILEFIAGYSVDYKRSTYYKSCVENGFQTSTPLLYQPTNDYKILEIGAEASLEDIKKAYITKIRQFHPDKNPHDPKAKEKFEVVLGAYRRLTVLAKPRVFENENEKEFHAVTPG